ncbi:MAG: hypothetical protein HYT89_02650 [Candidatus Omnitrophica bacterium]|nr:hypothetical protein [Candidatus Omnitrophota bacterium]
MKKAIGMLIFAVFLLQGAGIAFAAERGTPEYERLKEYKRVQREKRMNERKDSGANGSAFWSQELERSGLKEVGPKVGRFLKNLNPAPFLKEQKERYDERKAAGGK